MKPLAKTAASLLALVAAVVIVVIIYLNAIVGKVIETGCTRALGVETHVGFVRIGLLSGNFRIARLRIANPPGFSTDRFISIDSIHFEVPPKSLREDTIVVPLLEIDGVDVSLETAGGRTNYEVILDNLKRFTKSGTAEPTGRDSSAGDQAGSKRLSLREGVIRDIAATVELGKVSDHANRVVVEIPEIRLRPSKSTGSAQISVAELTQVVVTAVLTGIAKKAPTALAQGLFNGLSGLESVTLAFPKSLESGAGGAADAAKQVGKSAEGALKSLGGLFGGDDGNKRESPAAGDDQ